jgi:hypothetical protein
MFWAVIVTVDPPLEADGAAEPDGAADGSPDAGVDGWPDAESLGTGVGGGAGA